MGQSLKTSAQFLAQRRLRPLGLSYCRTAWIGRSHRAGSFRRLWTRRSWVNPGHCHHRIDPRLCCPASPPSPASSRNRHDWPWSCCQRCRSWNSRPRESRHRSWQPCSRELPSRLRRMLCPKPYFRWRPLSRSRNPNHRKRRRSFCWREPERLLPPKRIPPSLVARTEPQTSCPLPPKLACHSMGGGVSAPGTSGVSRNMARSEDANLARIGVCLIALRGRFDASCLRQICVFMV